MNVDYLFYRRPDKPGPYSLDDLGDIAPPIGPGDLVRAGIARVFAQIDWQESPDVPGAWFGTGGATFQFTAADGRVTSFMPRLERRSMLQLTREMPLRSTCNATSSTADAPPARRRRPPGPAALAGQRLPACRRTWRVSAIELQRLLYFRPIPASGR